MDEQNHPASRSGDYANDIEEMHFGGSTSEDDDDEPRLRIDTSEDEEENVLDNSSLSSSFSRRKPSSTSRLKTTVGSRGAPSTKKFDAKNTNPLQSLQQLVHSPFLNAQISAADGGINQGCKMNPLAKENRSKSNCDAQSLAAAAEALRNIFSHNANGGGGISNMAINNWDALPTPKPNSGSGAKSKKSSSAAKRNSTNFQRLSPVSIEVVPSLSHLLPLSQHSPPSPQMPKQQSDSNGNKSGSAGGRGKATNSNRLNYIVSKLQRSATEEEHLRQLQQLQSSPEAENFKMFQQFLKSGQFQTRCNNNNLEILPAAATAPAAPNTINLSNSKGFRYASSSAQTRPTFSFQTTTPLPPPPPLTFQSTPEFSNPTNRMDFRMPPTLTVIPKNTGNGNSGKKTNCRRSPPPMVPIESIANFRKPLNEDNVVYRLKKLGTDIELEKNTAASRDDSAPAEIEDVAAKAAPAPVTNNNSSNVSDKASLPFLKPIPIGERSANDLRNLAKLHPPPPSLIPIKPVTQLVPILPSLPQSTISEVPIKLKKTSKGRVPSFVSILPKVNVNQNDVLDMAAKIRMNASSGDKVDGSQFMFGKGSPSDVIFTRKEDMPGGFNQSNIDFSQLRLSAPKATKKKKRNRLSAKSEYTKLAHALVQAATPLPKKDDIDRPVIVPIRNEMPPKELDFDNVEGEIITIEPILMPQSRRESEEPFVNDAPSDHEDEFIHVPDNSSPRPETSTPTLPSMTPWSSGAPDDKGYFLFSPTQAIQVGVLPNGRKMLSCDICSGVYHKMFSLKKHYYRNHINPKFIWAKHADMFKVPPISSSLAVNPKSNRSMYFCSICECLFDEKAELSSHLTDHPPLTLENTNKNNSKLYVCPTCNTVFSKKRTQVRHSKKCAKLYETAGISAPTPPAKEPATDLPPSDDEAQDDNATEETNSTTSSKNEDVLEIDEVPSTSKNSKLETSMMCLFCELSFTDTTKRKKHVLQHHHPKRKQQPCVYCKNKTFSDLSDLLKHICEMHSKRYFGCAICKIRFRTKEDLVAHNAESHDGVVADADKEPIVEEKVTKVATVSNKNGKNYKCNQCPKVFINTVELGRHRKAAHRESSRNNVKKVVSAFSGSIDSNEQKYRSTIITTADYETEFYRNVCHNVKYNLENCMEGRIEMKKEENPPQDENDPRYADLPGGIEGGKEKSESLSFQDLYGTENIDSRFIQNVSRLHLETQLTMLRKANLLDKELDGPLRTKTSAAGRNSSIASHLALAEKSDGERAGDEAKNENDGANEIVFTGEWIRSRNYICGTCFARFNNFWDMDTHRWSRHPNVYGFYYEFVAEQTPGKNWAMKRSLLNHGSLGVTSSQNLPSSSTCTKCQKSFSPVSEFHKHILECGGDTTWTSMMFAAHTKRNKKWRPYGSRRRKNIARHRGLKRNIPTTPVKIIGPPRNRQKAGDTETIQRMIANLPPKRITRRVITFDDLDARPKGRFSNNSSSQSNILTRKRKESMDIKNSAASRSQQQQQQQQQHGDSKQNVTTSTTLIGTKNNTPYNSNRTVSTSKSHSKQTTTNATSVKETIPVREEAKRSEVVPDTSSASSSTTSSKNETIETEIKEEIAPEPQVSSIKVSTSKGGKTVKIIQARDVENISIKSPAPVTTSSQSESDTNAKSKPIERETVTESKLPTKTKSVVEEGGSTVVKITTSWKNQMSSGEPVSIRKLRSTDESSAEKMESASESKTNSSCDERIANSVTKTEPKSNSEICSTLELRSTTGSRNKSLVIQVQDDGKPKNEPVTIIRSDKKKKKRCTPITSKRLAPEIPTPSPVTAKKSENLPSSGEKSVPESTPEVTIEKPENLPVEVEKLVPEIAEVSTEKPEDTQVAPEKSASVTEPKVMTETPVDPPETPEMPEKLEPETAPQLTVENPDNDEPAKLEKMTPVMPPEITSTENSKDSSVPKEESIPEMPPVLVKETMHKEVATETMHKEVATETMHKEVTTETMHKEVATETMHKEVASKTETEIKTEAKEEPITSDVAVNSVATESQTEPEDSPKEVVNAVAVTTDKPVAESEEGEIDLSAIEPADEDGPLLPDTSVILAAMKETMRQTDAVISSMPITTNAGKKRKREEPAKCKKCGVKVEASANTTLICEGCTETPVKKSKPAASPVSKIEMFTCKTCHVSIPKNISAGNDETCDKCVAAAAAVVAAVVPVVAATPATAAVTATVPAAAIATVAATVAVKNDKPSPKKCSPKLKDTRIPPPPPFRCRKCGSIGLAPLDGSMFCDKCSRLQETVCLLCQSSYISDTNDKVCGKCMLAGSSKQKKRIVETDAPAIVTNIVTCNISEKKSLHCDVCKNATKCTCKRRTSGQLDRAATAEVACDSCGKMWKDEDNSSSSTCRMCRASRTPTKGDAARIPERNESIKCTDCGIVVVPISSEAAMQKLCDGCLMRRNERRPSNEIRYLDTAKSVARTGPSIQRSPNVFSGFAAAADDKVRNKIDEMKGNHHKEEERSVQVSALTSSPVSSTEHKTPMKNVKLICRGCYGVFDTVSSYKYHCDNCKHRNNDKKPLLSFAKRNTKTGAESTSQAEPNNGASFEILEGVQIKYVEMAGSSQSDKVEAGRETSQVPLVVYESDSSPMKKSDSSRSLKKHKRTHSSPETIMDTIESVIKSVCYDNVDPSLTFDSNNDDSDYHEKTPVKDVTSNENQQAEKSADDSSPNVSVSEKSTCNENTTVDLKTEPKKNEDDSSEEEPTIKTPKSKSSKKKASKRRKPAAKKSRKSDSTAETEKTSAADDDVDKKENPEAKGKQPTKKESIVAEDESRMDDAEKQSKKSSTNQVATSNDVEPRRTRRRACTAAVPAGRALRSRTKFYESLNDLKSYDDMEETKSEPEPMDVDQTSTSSSLPLEDSEKSTPTPRGAAKKRKSESNKNDAKKSKTESNNDLGFAVTKTNKTIPKNAKKNSSNDSKNFEQLDDEVESSSSPSANQTVSNDRPIVTRKTSDTSESSITTTGVLAPVTDTPLDSAKRRRSSEISINDQGSKYSSPSATPSNENGSRRNSTATVISSTGEFQNEHARSFFDEAQGLESGSEYADGPSSKNATPTYGYDELNGNSFPEPYDSTEGTSHNSSPSYSNAWDFFGQKSLGSIIDTMNEILSRPEVSSCSSETVELFREEMMMFQHFGREISAIDKQEEESKQDEETTTIIDLDEISRKSDDKSKSKTKSDASCSNTNTFSEECGICDQTFSEPNAALSHMSSAHHIGNTNKNIKDSKLKQNNKSNQNGMKTNTKHKCSHCQKVLQNQHEALAHMKEHWKSFISSKNSDNSSHLKNSIAGKLEELLLDKALMNYLKSPQETQNRNSLPLKILNQISLAKKNQFTNWKSALAQMLDVDTANSSPPTTASGPASPVEPALPPAPVETKPEEKTKTQATETPNPELVDNYPNGYPCPMCNKTFQYTRLRNTHLIMVHAPRQSTHKHLIEGKNNSKKGEKNKSSNENRNSNARSSSTRGKVIQSYLLNDSVNTVKKSDSQDDSSSPSAKTARPTSTSSSTAVTGSKNTKKQEKRTATSKSTPAVSVAPPSSSSSTTATTTVTAATSTTTSTPTTTSAKPNPTTNTPAKLSGNDDDQSNAKKKKPCRKKMSKKEMNLPAAIVKMKAEQALLQLCNSRFNRICSQT